MESPAQNADRQDDTSKTEEHCDVCRKIWEDTVEWVKPGFKRLNEVNVSFGLPLTHRSFSFNIESNGRRWSEVSTKPLTPLHNITTLKRTNDHHWTALNWFHTPQAKSSDDFSRSQRKKKFERLLESNEYGYSFHLSFIASGVSWWYVYSLKSGQTGGNMCVSPTVQHHFDYV